MSKTIKILIADDHQMFLDGLKLIFSDIPGFQIVAEARNGIEVLEAFKNNHIDVAILDINMPEPNGLEVCKRINQSYPECKMVMLTMYNDENFIQEFLKFKPIGYVLKNAGKIELLNAIEAVLENKNYVSSSIRSNPTIDDEFTKKLQLTKRELEIIALLVKEKSTNEIAEELFISTNTVSTHRKNILHKLGVKNAAGLIRFAMDNKLT